MRRSVSNRAAAGKKNIKVKHTLCVSDIFLSARFSKGLCFSIIQFFAEYKSMFLYSVDFTKPEL